MQLTIDYQGLQTLANLRLIFARMRTLDDADLWGNSWTLITRMRDLFKSNPIFLKYRDQLWKNISGRDDRRMRMK